MPIDHRSAGKIVLLAIALPNAVASPASAQSPAAQSFRELLDRSEKERKGLMSYVKRQTIGRGVVKINADSVEVRNPTYNRIVIRLDSIDALASN